MENLLQTPLHVIVEKCPAVLAVLEKHHISYCHFSKKNIEEISHLHNLPSLKLAYDIQQIVNQQKRDKDSLSNQSFSELINYITQHYHTYLKIQLPIVLAQLEKIAQKHGDQLPILSDVLFYFEMWKDEITAHLIYEESKLFPIILTLQQTNHLPKELSKNYIDNLINLIEKEHDHSSDLIEKIKSVTQNFTPPPQACKGIQLCFKMLSAMYNNLSEHTLIENTILIPKALQQLNKLYQLEKKN
ncbi:hemerythrin domain-containing protein [Hydrotalea sp.]|uniref:hemerythrin domain-containing protein n=1 Tax=Hydrotalea sp. TaxID=2881279 RepID=UPI003D0E29DC